MRGGADAIMERERGGERNGASTRGEKQYKTRYGIPR